MDIVHPDFINSIAIDSRIKKITEKLGCTFKSYNDHEEFYLKIGKEAGLNGWKTDRILYNFYDTLLRKI